jgi:DNA-binding MarR family transcriptional regulator
MTSESTSARPRHDNARDRRRTVNEVKGAMRDLRVQLSLLNHSVGMRAGLKDADLDCLDLISIHAPISPSALAPRAGLHPATMTGILDRLESGGWIVRERDPDDRRAVLLRAVPERNRELFQLYAGMNVLMDELSSDYDREQLELIAAFLQRATDAGAQAAEQLGATRPTETVPPKN